MGKKITWLGKNSIGEHGFSYVEITIVIVVISILAMLVLATNNNSRNSTYQTTTDADMDTIVNAARLYINKYNHYPADTNRGMPSDLKEFVDPNVASSIWSTGTYPGSVFDWDVWDLYDATNNKYDPGADGISETVQISLRFCPAGGPLSACHFPSQSWASGFNINSSYYYCVTGYCRSHGSEAWSYPGYCRNCLNHQAIKTPDGK
jgi:prepilin-type N-terminal cleavage/methylation domain-containing protein